MAIILRYFVEFGIAYRVDYVAVVKLEHMQVRRRPAFIRERRTSDAEARTSEMTSLPDSSSAVPMLKPVPSTSGPPRRSRTMLC